MAALDTSANSVGYKRHRRWVLLPILLLAFSISAIASPRRGLLACTRTTRYKKATIVVLSGGLPYREANGAANSFVGLRAGSLG